MSVAKTNLQVEISYKQIMKITLPIAIAILIPQLNFFINNIFLAHYDEKAVLGIAGITGVYYLIFSSIGTGLNNGLQSLISRRAGENNASAIGKYYGQGVWLAMALAAVGIIVTYLLFPIILRLFIKDEAAVKMAIHFMHIRIWGLPFLYFFQMRNALMIGTNNSKYLPIGTAAETAVNIILDYALIFGKLGLPQLGFDGAAYASVATDFTGMLVSYLVISKTGMRERFAIKLSFLWDKVVVANILKQSGPLMFQHAISIIVWLFFFLLLGGTADYQANLAVSNTMRNVFGLFGVITWALGSTTNTMVSNVIGQGRQQELRLVWRKLITTAVVSSTTISVFLFIFPGYLFSFFSSNETLIIKAIPVIRVIAFAMIIMSVSMVALSTVIGAGFTKYSLMTEIISTAIYCGYTWYIVGYLDSALHISWTNEVQYWGVMLLFNYLLLRRKVLV